MAIRLAVVGMGARGREWVREVRADAAYELVACVDVDPARLDAAAVLGVPPTARFGYLGQALDSAACEAVIVAIPPYLHAEACELALSRGAAVLVEKPFTLDLGEAAGLVALADRQGTPLLVSQNYRYLRVHRAARRLIREGVLGRVGTFVCQYYRAPMERPQWLATLPDQVLWEVGVHHLDALRSVLDRQLVGVMSERFAAPWSDAPEGSSMQALLSFDGGIRGVYSATWHSSGHEFFQRGSEFYERFVGERATLHVYHRWLLLCERGKLPRIVRRGPRPVTEDSLLLRQLEGALLHGQEPDSSGRDNLQTMAALAACVRSATERRWVNPQELLAELPDLEHAPV
jgi:predicted dehydrogenase